MEVLLIEGNIDTGKTTLCKMIEKNLIGFGFKLLKREPRPLCGYEQDFTAIYNNGEYNIIINSESESGGIKRLKRMYSDNKKLDYNLLITAIRPKDINKSLNKLMKDIYQDDYKKEHIIKLEKSENDYCIYLKDKLEKDFISILDEHNCKLGTKL